MPAENVMRNIRSEFERSRMTLTGLGEGLGYHEPTAKKRAWSLLYRTSDPRISTVLAVAQTLGVRINRLLKEDRFCAMLAPGVCLSDVTEMP